MSINQFSAGDIIRFERYPQGRQGQVMPIEWCVLNVLGERALLLAQHILDVQPYAREDGFLFWGSFHLRSRRAEEFIPHAFSSKEMGQVCQPEQPGHQDTDMMLWQLFGMDDAVESVHEAVFVLNP